MSDLISRLSDLRSRCNCFDETERDAYHTLSDAIEALKERKTGKWIKKKNIIFGDYYECSICNDAESMIAPGWWNAKNFCPNCGAKMGVQDEET